MRTCTRCRVSKDLDEFSRVRRGEEKRKSQCKDCIREMKGHKPHPHWDVIQRNKELLPLGRKICVACHVEQDLTDYWKHSASRGKVYLGGLAPRCKTCVTRADRMRKYGLTLDQVLEAEAITHCPGCERELGKAGTKRCFDHCHDTGTFRRVLCETCNIAVGMAGNSPIILRRLADLLG